MYPQGDIWSGPVVFTLDKVAEVVQFANWFHDNNTGHESFLFGILGAAPGAPMPVLFVLPFMNGTQENAEKFFKPLLDIGPVANMTRVMPYKAANEQIPNREEEKRRILGGVNFVMPLDAEFVNSVVSEFVPFVTAHSIGEGSGVLFEMFPNKKIQEVAPDATAFASRGTFYHAATMFTWEDASLDQEIRLFNRKIGAIFKKRGFQGTGGQYNNYDGKFASTFMFVWTGRSRYANNCLLSR